MRLGAHSIRPYPLYLMLASGTSFFTGISYATVMVYWVTDGRLNPLQLLLLGTGLELSYFIFQLPTGVLADLVSRRLCTLGGLFIEGLGMLTESLSPAFAALVLGQVLIGLGAALANGAQEAWIADELGMEQMTSVYLRATQLGLVATVAGSLLSGVIALGGLSWPLRIGGGLCCVFAVALAFEMPERNFRRVRAEAGLGSVVSRARGMLAEQTRSAHRAIVSVPGLVLLFGMTFFTGLWSESFDRLWGTFLIHDITFPRLASLNPAMWFSVIACMVAVGGLAATELARRRTERLGPDSVVGALLALALAIGAGAVIMATAHSFVVAVAAYLAVSLLRPVYYPLVDGWMVTRIDPAVRATALSAKDMFDSAGQILGGPVIGAIGTLASIRIALLAGAATLAPAAACIVAASRRIRPRTSGSVADAQRQALEAEGQVLEAEGQALEAEGQALA
jgi:MFS transporter, DHA3 family, tetracycline resistance protein